MSMEEQLTCLHFIVITTLTFPNIHHFLNSATHRGTFTTLKDMLGAFLEIDVSRLSLEREQLHLTATNYVGIASYTILIYDHLLTFSDEVEYIWKGHKGAITYLFFINRYLFPFAFIPNLYAYLSPDFNLALCHHFVRYEGSCVVVGLAIAGLMMILRVNALYGGKKIVQAVLGIIWLAQLSVYAWFLARGTPVPRTLGSRGCSMIFSSRDDGRASLSAAIPLVFDTAVLVMTIYKTRQSLCYKSGTLMPTLLRDGVLYYSVIFSVNLALTIMILKSPPGIKNILGQLAELMTVTMLSRITLHLRKVGKRTSVVCYDDHSHRSSNVGRTGISGSSGCALLDPSLTSNPLDTVFSTTRTSFSSAQLSSPSKNKCPARFGNSEGVNGQRESMGSVMCEMPITFAKRPEMTIRRRESSAFVGGASSTSDGAQNGQMESLEEV